MGINKMETDFKLIPMSEITDEARLLAVRWYDGVSEMNDIREKHKLASDVMNYARRYSDQQNSSLIKEVEEWQTASVELKVEFIRLHKHVSELERKLSEKESQISQLKEALEKAENHIGELQRKLDEQESYFDDLSKGYYY